MGVQLGNTVAPLGPADIMVAVGAAWARPLPLARVPAEARPSPGMQPLTWGSDKRNNNILETPRSNVARLSIM